MLPCHYAGVGSLADLSVASMQHEIEMRCDFMCLQTLHVWCSNRGATSTVVVTPLLQD
jgi:hypothetical protein